MCVHMCVCDSPLVLDPSLAGMPDIERLARKLEAQRASLADLCQLYRASSVLPRLEEALRCHEVRLRLGCLLLSFIDGDGASSCPGDLCEGWRRRCVASRGVWVACFMVYGDGYLHSLWCLLQRLEEASTMSHWTCWSSANVSCF
jgi:hypothetical protein